MFQDHGYWLTIAGGIRKIRILFEVRPDAPGRGCQPTAAGGIRKKNMACPGFAGCREIVRAGNTIDLNSTSR